MARYKELWGDELRAANRLRRELKEAQEYRDIYLSFIRETAFRQEEFLYWMADRAGVDLGSRPKCIQCGLDDGACICAHLVAQ